MLTNHSLSSPVKPTPSPRIGTPGVDRSRWVRLWPTEIRAWSLYMLNTYYEGDVGKLAAHGNGLTNTRLSWPWFASTHPNVLAGYRKIRGVALTPEALYNRLLYAYRGNRKRGRKPGPCKPTENLGIFPSSPGPALVRRRK